MIINPYNYKHSQQPLIGLKQTKSNPFLHKINPYKIQQKFISSSQSNNINANQNYNHLSQLKLASQCDHCFNLTPYFQQIQQKSTKLKEQKYNILQKKSILSINNKLKENPFNKNKLYINMNNVNKENKENALYEYNSNKQQQKYVMRQNDKAIDNLLYSNPFKLMLQQTRQKHQQLVEKNEQQRLQLLKISLRRQSKLQQPHLQQNMTHRISLQQNKTPPIPSLNITSIRNSIKNNQNLHQSNHMQTKQKYFTPTLMQISSHRRNSSGQSLRYKSNQNNQSNKYINSNNVMLFEKNNSSRKQSAFLNVNHNCQVNNNISKTKQYLVSSIQYKSNNYVEQSAPETVVFKGKVLYRNYVYKLI